MYVAVEALVPRLHDLKIYGTRSTRYHAIVLQLYFIPIVLEPQPGLDKHSLDGPDTIRCAERSRVEDTYRIVTKTIPMGYRTPRHKSLRAPF